MRPRHFNFRQVDHKTAIAGFVIFSISAPHSIAAAEIGLGIAAIGWLVRLVSTRRSGLRRSPLDLPILLYFAWTLASAFLSEEPRISLLKMQSVCVVFVFYLAQSIISRSTAVILVTLMISSGCVGAVWSAVDLIRGRGVIVEAFAGESPFHATPLGPGDALWQVGGKRVYSVNEIDGRIREAAPGTQLSMGVISHGEHALWSGIVVTDEIKTRASPSGLFGTERTHRFRASGWTRHYESFAEILQILAQLALGLALANLGGKHRWRYRFAAAATALLATGVILTAMRTVLVALAVGASVIAWRAAQRRLTLLIAAAIIATAAFGALAVWQTRASHALELGDSSSSLRWRVARAGLRRIMLHPMFGHGMDSMHKHWNEWGFPANDMLHMHSTPLQLAFDRGLPVLVFWFWFIAALWSLILNAGRLTRGTTDFNRYGLLLGAAGAMAGFFASSIVNYNLGSGVVALVFWWLAGIVTKLAREEPNEYSAT